MHASVLHYVANVVAMHELGKHSVLEVGGLDVNGSVRHLFEGEYVSTDMREGPGVDHVINAHELSRSFADFDVVVCTEMLEHDDQPWKSVQEMRRSVRDRGLLILTCRGYDERGAFPLHDYPSDLWRYSVQGVEALLRYGGWEPVRVEKDPEAPGVFALAVAG